MRRRSFSRIIGPMFLAVLVLTVSATVSLAQGPVVAVMEHPTLGTILTGPDGWVLYTWAGDAPGVSNCPEDCLERSWPAYWASEPMSGGRITTIALADGRLMYALDGWPLHYGGARDPQPGDANGHGSTGVGALWSVVTIDFAIRL